MNRLISLTGTIGIASCLISCGGGGGGGASAGGNSSTPSPVELNASVYSGNFVSSCIPVANGTNYETGAALYVIRMLSVGAGVAANAPMVLRLDFFDNATCTGQSVGTLQNNNASNVLNLVSATSINGQPANRLILNFGNPSVSYHAGPTGDTVIYGTALRLKLPYVLIAGGTTRDLWSLNNNNLYEGNYAYDTSGFPTGLLPTPLDTNVASLPAAPEAPCAAQTLNWTASGNSCVGLIMPSASQLSQLLASTPGVGTIGGASFTCSNGVWSAPANATCRIDVPVVATCPIQTITWSSGANTCSGNTPVTVAGTYAYVGNTSAGNSGGQVMSCQLDGTWTVWAGVSGNCLVKPPPVTDPLQLAQLKNCLNCHTVADPGYTDAVTRYTFPSFQTIANYYRSSPPAAGVLENKIKAGSVGDFGTIPMASNPQVSDADLAILVPWILSQPQ